MTVMRAAQALPISFIAREAAGQSDADRLRLAVDRLDPASRAMLEVSTVRELPDHEIAEVLGTDADEVARRRAEVVERLAEDLGVRGNGPAVRRLRSRLPEALAPPRRPGLGVLTAPTATPSVPGAKRLHPAKAAAVLLGGVLVLRIALS
jgi:hypothetical protein